MDYKSQYKHPNWQKKRLEILQRDLFTCSICGETEKQLHVHHKQYLKGRNVWDYDDDNLITLCEDCHAKQHEKPEQPIASPEYANLMFALLKKNLQKNNNKEYFEENDLHY